MNKTIYLHIGNNYSVDVRDIIGIFDMDNCTWSKRSREFLNRAEANGELIAATDNLPKSFVLTSEYGMHRIYLVQFNSATIEKRRLTP